VCHEVKSSTVQPLGYKLMVWLLCDHANAGANIAQVIIPSNDCSFDEPV
jgi:hypothetical protein